MEMWRLSRIEQELAEHAGLIVTVGKYSLKRIVHYYNVNPEKIRVIHNGVDCESFKPMECSDRIKQQLGIADKQCVLFVGRLVPRKGLYFLIEAAQQIVKERKDTAFVIVGDGPLHSHLVEYLKKIGLLKYFVFVGAVWGKPLPILYNCADVFTLPSIQEGQSLVLLEAQASGKPVVAFDVGAANEAVKDKITGRLTKPNSDLLAQAILDLLANKPLREKMGAQGRDFVSRNFSWRICAEKTLQVYREVAG